MKRIKKHSDTGSLNPMGERIRSVEGSAENASTWSIGDALRKARVEMGWSQEQLAETTGASKRGIQDNEAGKTIPGGTFLRALVLHGISANWLLTGVGEMWLGSMPPAPPSPPIDHDLLAWSVSHVERFLANRGVTLPLEKKALWIAVVYEHFQGKRLAESVESVERLLSIAT